MKFMTDFAGTAATLGQAKADIEGSVFLQKESNKIDRSLVNNNTLLKQGISLGGAVLNVFSDALFGVKIPVYEGTLGDRLINPEKSLLREATYSDISAEERTSLLTKETPSPSTNKPELKISKFHETTRNIANAAISVANVGLYIGTRSYIPLFDTNLKRKIEQRITNSSTQEGGTVFGVKKWYKEQVTDKLNTPGAKLSTLGKIAYAASHLNVAHQAWGNLIKSKFVYHTINFGVGATLLASSGPVGWSIAGALTAVDITRGSIRVNRVQVKQDHLEHLTSIHESQTKIKQLEEELAKKRGIDIERIRSQDSKIVLTSHEQEFKTFLADIGKPKTPQHSADKAKDLAHHDDLNKATMKATTPTLFKEGISLATSAAMAATNHVGMALATTMAFLSFSTNTKEILNEQQAKDAVVDKIHSLERATGYVADPKRSRQYEIGAAAKEHAMYEQALNSACNKPGLSPEEYKHEADTLIGRDPEKKRLFATEKTEAPTNSLSYAYRAAKSTVFSIGSYLHPIKEPPTYAVAYTQHRENLEKRAEAAHHNAPAPSAPDRAHSQTRDITAAERAEAYKERESLSRRSTSTPGPVPLSTPGRSKCLDSGGISL